MNKHIEILKAYIWFATTYPRLFIKMKSKKLLYKFWLFVEALDSFINHGIIDEIFNLFPVENKDSTPHISYKIWLATSHRFCEWWIIDVYEKWFGKEK